MISITCGCKGRAAKLSAQGGIKRAKTTLDASLIAKPTGTGRLQTLPIKKQWKKCLPNFLVTSSVGSGPIYDISIDPFDIVTDCSGVQNYNNYGGYSYSYECTTEDGKFRDDILQNIVNRGHAEIEYRIPVEPNDYYTYDSNTKLLASPQMFKKYYEKEFESAYRLIHKDLNGNTKNETPKVLDAKLSKDGSTYVFAYLNLLGNAEFGVNEKPPQSCDEYNSTRGPDWTTDDDLTFVDEPDVPQVFVAIFRRVEDAEGNIEWELKNKIATGYIDFSVSEGTLFGGLAVSSNGNTVVISNQEEDSIFTNNGRVKIFQYNEADGNFVRIDDILYNPDIESCFNPQTYERNYTQDKFRNSENLIAKRKDGEVVFLGPSEYAYGSTYEKSLENINTLKSVHSTSTEIITANTDARTSDAFAAIKEDNSVILWGNRDIGGAYKGGYEIKDIQQIAASENGFAAITLDKQVLIWGANNLVQWNQAAQEFQAPDEDFVFNASNIYSNKDSFVVLNEGTALPYSNYKQNGGSPYIFNGNNFVEEVDLTDIKDVFATKDAFAAIKLDGTVVAWGQQKNGGDVLENSFGELTDVTKIYPRLNAFSAIKSDGSVATWGNINRVLEGVSSFQEIEEDFPEFKQDGEYIHIDPSEPDRGLIQPVLSYYDEDVKLQLSLASQTVDDFDKKKFFKIVSNPFASVAIRQNDNGDGNHIVAWGDVLHGARPYKDIFDLVDNDQASQGVGVDKLFGNTISFYNFPFNVLVGRLYRFYAQAGSAYFNKVFRVVTTNSSTREITVENIDGSTPNIQANSDFDGKVFRLTPVESTNLGELLDYNDFLGFVENKGALSEIRIGEDSVVSNYYCFAAIKTDGSLLAWGLKNYGGQAPELEEGDQIVSIASTLYSFAALTSSGKVIAWGKPETGGDVTFNARSSEGDTDVSSGVVKIHSARNAFMAIREDNSVVVWGDEAASFGIKLLGPDAVGIFGRSPNYGMGYSVDCNSEGDIVVIGNKKQSYTGTQYFGSVSNFKKNGDTGKWERHGNTITSNVLTTPVSERNIALGRTVKNNYSGDRIFAYEVIEKIIDNNNSLTTKQFHTIGIYDYVEENNSWKKFQNVDLPKDHAQSLSPFINTEYAIKTNSFIDIDASGDVLAIGSIAQYGEKPDDLNGLVEVHKLDKENQEFVQYGSGVTPFPMVSGETSWQINSSWVSSRLFGENVSLSHDGTKLLVSEKDIASVYQFTSGNYYGETIVEWKKTHQFHTYDLPDLPYVKQRGGVDSLTRTISAHMSSGADFVSTTFSLFNHQGSEYNQYQHRIFNLEEKPISDPVLKYDFDSMTAYDSEYANYLAVDGAQIQHSGEYKQYEINGSRGISLGAKNDHEKMTFAFWCDISDGVKHIISYATHSITVSVSENTTEDEFDKNIVVDYSHGNFPNAYLKTFDTIKIKLPRTRGNQRIESDLYHFTICIDRNPELDKNNKTQKYIQLYFAGESVQKDKDGDIHTRGDDGYTQYSYIGSNFNDVDSFGDRRPLILDQVRVYDTVLDRNTVFKLANHRKVARRQDTYIYDVVEAQGNNFKLEFRDSTYIDIPIDQFCTILQDRDECGALLDSECQLDAQIKFCYYTGRPHPSYVKSFVNNGVDVIPPSNDISGSGFVVPVSDRNNLITENPEDIIDFNAENYFIVGDDKGWPHRSIEEELKKVFANGAVLGSGGLRGNEIVDHSIRPKMSGILQPKALTSIELRINANPTFNATIESKYLDKWHGDYVDWTENQILYPIADSGNNIFVNQEGFTTNALDDDVITGFEEEKGILFDSINEGVFTGGDYRYTDKLTNDSVDYIQASSLNTEFEGFCKFEMTRPLYSTHDTRLRMRLSGPTRNFECDLPPIFHFSDIKFENASGDLLVQYEDFQFIGDSNQYEGDPSYVTYSLKPKANFTTKYQWQDDYPLYGFDDPSGYTLSFNVKSEDPGRPYGPPSAFTFGWAGDNDYTASDKQFVDFYNASGFNPTLRISAIEIYNSGRLVPYREQFINMSVLGQETGNRIERIIKPKLFLSSSYDNDLYPALSGVVGGSGWLWQDNTGEYSNATCLGARQLTSALATPDSGKYITSNHVVNDSGKLIVKFGHAPADTFYEVEVLNYNNAFSSIFNRWFDKDIGVMNAKEKIVPHQDGYFEFDYISLRVLASKNTDARDYVLDVVGYSEDCLLNSTPAKGGFLQNASGHFLPDFINKQLDFYPPVGTIPVESGFDSIDDLGLFTEAASDKDQYFITSETNNIGGDHHLITEYPVVDKDYFQWYEVPLYIYDDTVELGRSKKYNLSTLLENIYLDIYPLPSGANIAAMELAVRYKPQSSLELVVEGGEYRKLQDGRSEGSFYPTPRGQDDDVFNAGSGYAPLSRIENIPHGYDSPNTAKFNYARRWKGRTGVVNHPFDMREFNRGFEEKRLETNLLDAHTNLSLILDDGGSISIPSRHNIYNKGGVYTKYLSAGTLPDTIRNIGLRFNSDSFFSSLLPGYSSDYKTADWTALSNGGSNFEDNPLYGQIFDGYDAAIRVDRRDEILYTDLNLASGACFYVKFIPDANMSGVEGNLYEFSTLLSVTEESPSDTGIMVGFSGGYLFASGNEQVITDPTPYSGYQYPLSVLVTYSENADKKLRLYTDNELQDQDLLRATSDSTDISSIYSNLRFGYGGSAVSGANMILCDAGFSTAINQDYMELSSGCNIVSSGNQLTFNQISTADFFRNQRMKFFNPGESHENDDFDLWSYVDENTAHDWYLGAFRSCEFSFNYDSLNGANGKRTGRDYINFTLDYDGTPYTDSTNIALPSSINSGVAYHTQIENDFLRFYLSDTDSEFYSTHKRISKSLPRGYDFAEKALVVETVIDHISSGDMTWECGEEGPKLIVSLYTKNKEPYWNSDEPNWGLINRHSHFLQPSSCLIRLDSTFTYGDWCDDSEQWALFPKEPQSQEFKEKFYSKDIDDMFVQYDLVFPSGSEFNSNLNIHTTHVRAEDAWLKPAVSSGTLPLISSGNITQTVALDMYTFGVLDTVYSSGLQFLTSGMIPWESSGTCLLLTSGNFPANEIFPLLTKNSEFVSNTDGVTSYGSIDYEEFVVGNGNLGFYLVTSGSEPPTITPMSGQFKMLTEGWLPSTGNLPLSIANNQIELRNNQNIGLFTFSHSDTLVDGAIQDSMPMFLLQVTEKERTDPSNATLTISTIGRADVLGRYRDGTLPMSLKVGDADQISSGSMPLMLDALPEPVELTRQLDLFLGNYGVKDTASDNVAGSYYVFWDGQNYGTSTEIDDESFFLLPANDEIRGVDLFGYGDCDSDSPDKAFDKEIVSDDVVWRAAKCNDGGIFRATETYTNAEAGYQDEYYGIRKYTGLKPGRPYNVSMYVKTGDTTPIPVPYKWEEWEYGICGPGTIGDQDQQTLNFSGVKLIGDYPFLSGDASITSQFQIDSGRQEGDKYGKAVCVKEDLMAVSAPFHKISDGDGDLIDDAGAIFLYRRQDDTAGRKADWHLEEKLMLPESFRRDYVVREIGTLINFGDFSIGGKKWAIGQEGREFGHSVDIAKSGEKETIVVGAPGAKWTRQFPEIVTSGIPVLMTVFTDKFEFNLDKMAGIRNAAAKYNILYKYFAKPWGVDPDIWQPEIDLQLLICQIYNSDEIDDLPFVPNGRDNRGRAPSWFNHVYINDLTDGLRPDDDLVAEGLEKIKDKFFEIFPYTDTIYSGIPPIVGIFGDDTFSTNNKASYKEILDEFVDFYEDYSVASGVANLETDTARTGYVNKIFSDSFQWDAASVNLIENTMSTGNLISKGYLNYITTAVGQEYARDDSEQFQIPPDSGGRVYIFEKESGSWNFVQEFVSPAESFEDGDGDYLLYQQNDPDDRYGHAVSISENGEIISVGAPYSAEACQIYERSATANNTMYNVLYDWLTETHDVYGNDLQSHIDRYNLLITASGKREVAESVYYDLSKENKFLLRKNKNINLYEKIFKYDYTDIKYTGTWGFIAEEFAGTSRLGYSTAVSEDGRTVAFGAPTDSFNEFDDLNVWYGGVTNRSFYPENNTWASYTNAGAVRMFESRTFHPHNKVVEFYKFGNLDRSTHRDLPGMSDYYEQLAGLHNADGHPFERTDFADIEIPTDAGLAYIITPEIDAASDEIIDNIKSWLALGDRTLVLVGNDPVWKENRLYQESNEIINKILKKLGCRMRIVPARSREESLYQGVPADQVLEHKYNVTPAHLPQYAHNSDAIRENMYASGVADIRIDLSDLGLEDLKIYSPCDPKKYDRCVPPIEHMGDLRSEWEAECATKVEYYENWAFHFDTENPGQQCDFYPEIVKPYVVRPDEEITPVLTAAEYAPQKSRIIPAASGEDEKCTTSLSGIITETFTNSWISYKFAQDHVGDVVFNIQDLNNNINGVFDEFTKTGFANPTLENGRDGFLQGVGTDYAGESKKEKRIINPDSPFISEEKFSEEETSLVYLIASLVPENAWSMGLSPEQAKEPRNKDQNIVFYNNLVMPSCNERAKIYQLGGWTGRTSFKDAFSDSVIKRALENQGHVVTTNVEIEEDTIIPENVSLLWIANPVEEMPDNIVGVVKKWLSLGDKKIVMTYDRKQSSAHAISLTCDKLGLKTKPYHVESEGKYYVQFTEVVKDSNLTDCCPISDGLPEEDRPQILNKENDVIKGCPEGYTWVGSTINKPTKIDKLSMIPEAASPISLDLNEFDPFGDGYNEYAYIPINVHEDSSKVVTFNDPIYETFWSTPDTLWRIDGQSNITFPAIANSGYRIFVKWVSESDQEKYRISMDLDTNTAIPSPEPDGESSFAGEAASKYLEKTNTFAPSQTFFDVRVKDGKESISFSLDTNEWRIIKNEDLNGALPLTPRVLAVSGYLLPIEEELVTNTRKREKKIYITECSGVPWSTPERIIEVPPKFRPISTNHVKYCNPNADICDELSQDLDVEDGPVIVADELEHFTNFDVGARRSRIVLITDSSMVQGFNYQYRSKFEDPNVRLIRSLYPATPENILSYSDREQPSAKGTLFEFKQKLRAPEKGSPAKFFAASGNQYLVDRFGLNGNAGQLDLYTDQEDTYVLNDVYRRFTPKEAAKIKQEIERFGEDVMTEFGTYPRFSGNFYNPEKGDIDHYVDANIKGGISKFMEQKGYDYIDFEALESGYVGDLFGWSLDIHENKLVVGTPFNAFNDSDVVTWSGVSDSYDQNNLDSTLKLSGRGGAGAVFYYERTGRGTNAVSQFLPWEFKQKIKPTESLDIGIDDATSGDVTAIKGNHGLSDDFALNHAYRGDMFGHSVSIDSDFLMVGAPCHDFEIVHEHIYSGTSAFLRKEFTSSFEIPDHKFYDLGPSGTRVDTFDNQSGTMVLNHGAAYTFKHLNQNILDQSKNWEFAQKIVSQGYEQRKQGSPTSSGTENDFFGYAVAIDRAKRGDSDYTSVVGAINHQFPTSGNHISSAASGAGAAYTYDAMLRKQPNNIPNPGSYISPRLYGLQVGEEQDILSGVFYQNETGPPVTYRVSGIIYANMDGELFLEVSGYDPSDQGFVGQRPYIHSAIGELLSGTEDENTLRLITAGKPVEASAIMPVSILGADSAIVYNSIGFVTENAYSASGNLFQLLGSGHGFSSGVMGFLTEGHDLDMNEQLKLRIRGK